MTMKRLVQIMPCLLPLFALVSVVFASEIPIEKYGAVPGADDDATAASNGFAIAEALARASAGDVVLVPAGKTYYIFPNRTHQGLEQITLQIDGVLKARTNYSSWPTVPKPLGSKKLQYLNIFEFINCTGLTLKGTGEVDGQGSVWWWAFAEGKLKIKRPLMLVCTNCVDLEIKDLLFLNSPRFNLLVHGHGIEIHNVSIIAEWQLLRSIQTFWRESLASKSASQAKSLMFPFNTDGIDPSGTNIHIYNCSISNYDDVIAVKPGGIHDSNEGCTENVLVEDLVVYVGAGLSVGSVHPATTRNCVRNFMFRNIVMYSPLKGVYVKPDLGAEGTAIVENITYENIIMHQSNTPGGLKPPNWPPHLDRTEAHEQRHSSVARSVRSPIVGDSHWACHKLDYTCMEWPIYVGPQQQLEPDGSGSGIWPATEPKVTVKGLTLRNVKSHGGIWPNCAGVLRCNSSNPCIDVSFTDVVIEGRFLKCPFDNEFICDDHNSIVGNSSAVTPATKCIRGITNVDFIGIVV